MAQRQREGTATIPHWFSPDEELLEITDGDGSYVYDGEGNEYLDFLSMLYCVNAGHGNEAILDAMREQMERIQYVPPSKHSDVRTRLAREIADITPGSLSSTYFAISGSQANESAVQIARAFTDSKKVLSRWRSYHGGTYGAGALTGDPTTRNSLGRYAETTGSVKFLPPVEYGSPFNADSPEELAELAADHLEFVIRNEGPESIAAIINEPIGGSSGAFPGPADYFERVRELCDEYDILMISDEVIAGFGRCGEWFGIETEGVEPDIITFAKAATSAYVPLAGVVATEEIGEFIRDEGMDLGQTFAGNPVACAASLAAIEEYRGGMIDTVRENAPYFEERLGELESHDVVGDVRGRGYLWAVEFTDPATGEPFFNSWVDEGDNPVDEVIQEAEERGLLIGGGRPSFHVMLAPPFTAGREQIDEAVEALDASIEAVFG